MCIVNIPYPHNTYTNALCSMAQASRRAHDQNTMNCMSAQMTSHHHHGCKSCVCVSVCFTFNCSLFFFIVCVCRSDKSSRISLPIRLPSLWKVVLVVCIYDYFGCKCEFAAVFERFRYGKQSTELQTQQLLPFATIFGRHRRNVQWILNRNRVPPTTNHGINLLTIIIYHTPPPTNVAYLT